MREEYVRGIVIGHEAMGERDLRVTLFTRGGGRFSVEARGTTKAGSSLRRGVDLFCEGDYYLTPRRGMPLVTQFEPAEFFSARGWGREQAAAGLFMLRMVHEVTAPGAPEPELYDLFRNCLKYIEICGFNDIILLVFEVGVLACLGMRISWDECVRCGKRVRADAWFDVEEGGTVCGGCVPERSGGGLMKICFDSVRFGKNIDRALERYCLAPLESGRPIEAALTGFRRFCEGVKKGKMEKETAGIVRRFFQYHVNQNVTHWYMPL